MDKKVKEIEEIQALKRRLAAWPCMELEEVQFHEAVNFMRYVADRIDHLLSLLSKKEEGISRLNQLYNLELERVNKAENQHFQALLKLGEKDEEIEEVREERNSTFRDMEKYAQENFELKTRIKELEDILDGESKFRAESALEIVRLNRLVKEGG